MHRIKLALGLVMTLGIAQLASACVAHAGVSGEVVVADPTPQVVLVAPGVWVVENHHTAVFYSDGYYWRRSGSTWYRSSYYDDGFVVVHARVVPRRIYRVRSHRSYVRYRARSNARRARAVRRHNNRAARRDNRNARRHNRNVNRNNRRAVRRDNRANRRHKRAVKRDNRRNNRAVKRDHRRQKRQDKKKKKDRKKVRDYRR